MAAALAGVLALAGTIAAGSSALAAEACVSLYRKGVLNVPFNPAFLHVTAFPTGNGTETRDALLMSSFFNVEKDPAGEKVTRVFERDLTAWIPDLAGVEASTFDARKQLEVLTDRAGEPFRHVWPNESDRVPDGVVPFRAVVVPGGFLATPKPGRITVVNLDDPGRTEYVVVEAGTGTPDCSAGKTPDRIRNDRWFYHQALFHDMDGDGRKDLITARANLMPFLYQCPPVGELVWFRNPGPALKPDVPWEARVLVGLPAETNGPEVNLALADLDGDGVPEIIATHFFTSDNITVFGAPAGGQWKDVDPAQRPLRRKAIMTGQGRPFAVEPEDLNGDGRIDILTSNHQGDGCFDVTKDAIPGRVIALEQPASGRLFDEDWTTRILKDNIRPNPTFPKPVRGPGRLAPNRAIAFWPERALEGREKPWIVVGGDEASKVWVLKPVSERKDDWRYESVTIFDINDHYGANTTQTIALDPKGEVISTIGGLAWRYDRPGNDGMAELYIPVFEARQIHVFSFRKGRRADRVRCPADVTIACPAP
jgi:hypothetical protein